LFLLRETIAAPQLDAQNFDNFISALRHCLRFVKSYEVARSRIISLGSSCDPACATSVSELNWVWFLVFVLAAAIRLGRAWRSTKNLVMQNGALQFRSLSCCGNGLPGPSIKNKTFFSSKHFLETIEIAVFAELAGQTVFIVVDHRFPDSKIS
jgi:hypothetical protein